MIQLTQLNENGAYITNFINPDMIERIIVVVGGGCVIVFQSGHDVSYKEDASYVISQASAR